MKGVAIAAIAAIYVGVIAVGALTAAAAVKTAWWALFVWVW